MTSLVDPAAPAPPAPRRAPGPARRYRLAGLDMRYSPYLYIAPFFVLFAIFGVFPIVYTVYVSLFDYDLLAGTKEFVGLANYQAVLADAQFWNATYNTVGMFLVSTVPQLLLALDAGEPAQPHDARPYRYPDGHPHPQHHLGRGRRHHLRDDLRRPVRPGELAAGSRRRRPARLAGQPLRLLVRDRVHGRLALDRLQRADLPRRDAGHPEGPLRVGLAGRRRRAGGSSGRSPCRCSARRSSSRSSSRRSAGCSSSPSR